MMFRRFALVPLVLTASLGGADAHASTFEPLAFRDVVRRADLAFHGVVVGMHETAHASGRMAFTHVKFRVDEAIVDRNLGIVDGHVTLTFAGGTIGSTRIVVAGVPTFAVGDEAIVFAHHDGKTYANPCVGGDRGLYRVIRDRANGDAYPLDVASRAIESLVQREGQVRGQTRVSVRAHR